MIQPQKKKDVTVDDLDPFQYEGPACNVFDAKEKEETKR